MLPGKSKKPVINSNSMANWKWRSEILGDVVFFSYSERVKKLDFSEIYVWDLDKTYLDTNWHTLGDLAR